MANITWKPVNGFNWGTASNWDSNTLPTKADTVGINLNITVDGTTNAAAYLLNQTGGTFTLAGGTLTTYHLGIFSGTFQATGGIYRTYGVGAVFNTGLYLGSAATLAIASGTVTTNGGDISGTLTGPGQITFNGTNNYIEAGSKLSVGSMVIAGRLGLVSAPGAFSSSFTFTQNLRTLSGSTFELFGNSLTLLGNSQFDGYVAFGTIQQSGKLQLGGVSGQAVFGNGLILNVGGTVTQNNSASFGVSDSGAKVTVNAGATYRINGNYSISDPSSVGTLVNAGTLAKSFGSGTATIGVSFSTTGALRVASGKLLIGGVYNTLAGQITGRGTLALGGALNIIASTVKTITTGGLTVQAGVTRLTGALGYGGIFDQIGGVLNLDSSAASLTLSGQTNLDGGTLTGYGGSLTLKGRTELSNYVIGGPNNLRVVAGGFVDQTGQLVFGASSNPTLTIDPNATWRIQDNASVVGNYGTVLLQGNLLSYGNTNAVVSWNIQSAGGAIVTATGTTQLAAGTITVDGGQLSIASLRSVLGGTITGSGLLNLTQGTTTLAAGLKASVGTLGVGAVVSLGGALSYGGTLSLYNPGYLDLGFSTLTLTGTGLFEGGEIANVGTLRANGQSVLGSVTVGAGATLVIGGTAEQTGTVQLAPGDGPGTLVIASGASVLVNDDYGISGSTQSVLSIAGTLTLAATGTSTISSAATLTGTVNVQNELLTFTGGGALGGTLSGIGTVALNGGAYTLAAGTSIGLGDFRAAGGATLTTSGTVATASQVDLAGATLTLGGAPLTLSGSTTILGGVLGGAGQASATGSLTLGNASITGSAAFLVAGAGTALAGAQLTVGNAQYGTTTSAPVLGIAAGATLGFESAGSISGDGNLLIGGTLATNGNGALNLTTNIVDNGTIRANLGTINVMSAVSGSGAFSIGTGALLIFSNAATITASNTVSFGAGANKLLLSVAPKAFAANIANFATSDVIEFANLNLGLTKLTQGASVNQVLVSDGSTSFTLNFTGAEPIAQLSLSQGSLGSVALTHT